MKLNLSIISFLSIAAIYEHQCFALETRRTEKISRSKPKRSAERAITVWWVLFNKPSACTTDPTGTMKCGVGDIMKNVGAETNKPKIAIISATGGISSKKGFLRMTSSLYKTDCQLDLEADNGSYTWGGPPPLYKNASYGYCPAKGEETEVHIVIRDHGPVTKDKLAQITRFTDPSCSAGGTNICVDCGAVGFPIMSEDGSMTNDIGHFPMSPPGCAEAGDCTKYEERVQLQKDEGNEVTLIRTGDSYQVVVEITVPKLRVRE